MSRKFGKGVAVIITGASTGIGKALALLLAKKYKARLALNARCQSDLEAVANEARAAGSEVVTVCGDISNPDVIADLVDKSRTAFGKVDILVNNAGFARPGAMYQISMDDWRQVFEVNFFAPVQLVYKLLPAFLAEKRGTVVNIASVAGKIAFPGSVCYASSKFALTGFSEGMAAELGPRGIDVITVCPGLVRTEFFRKNKNAQDVTAMAEQKNLTGWVVKNVLSISSEQAAEEILRACEAGGCREIVLTGMGRLMERINGICPPVAWQLSRFVPAERQRGSSQEAQR
jgi:short-subunit dehydrogenase